MLRLLWLRCRTALLIALVLLSLPRPLPAGVGPVAQAGKSLAGQFLVSTEDMPDPRFARTVIYMLRHDASGALGLIVNKPRQEVPLAPILRHFGLDDRGVTMSIRLHYGGPVEPAAPFLLHSAEYATEGTEPIVGNVAVTPLGPPTGRPLALANIARGAGPRRFLFLLGYAGWAPRQLEGEIDAGAWISVPADEALLFDDDASRKWERAMALRRITI